MCADTLTVGVVGASGRLGSRLVNACEAQRIPVVLKATSTSWDRDRSDPAVVFDASRAAALERTAGYCAKVGAALVICASDVTDEHLRHARALAATVPVVWATNLSLVHWLQRRLAETAAHIATQMLEVPTASVRERHTAAKLDRPSASARSLAAVWDSVHGDGSVSEICSYRAGLAVSDHALDLTFSHETLTLKHDVRSLEAVIPGALLTASWAHTAPAGYHTIDAVFDAILIHRQQNGI